MPAQLRLLNSYFSVTAFSFHSSRSISVFNSIFPFKLKCPGFSRMFIPSLQHSAIRTFSSRSSFRSRTGSDGRNPNFSHGRGPQRGGFRAGRGGQGKSLIEDEAELSDMVGGLKADSFHLGLSSTRDDSDRDSRVRVRDRGTDRDSVSSIRNRRGAGRGGFSSSRRLRDSGSDDSPIENRRGSRNSRGSVSKRRFDDSDSDVDEEDEDFSSRPRRQYGSRDGFSQMTKRGGKDSGLSHRIRESGKPQMALGTSQLTKKRGIDSGLSYRIRESGRPQMAGKDSGRQVLRSSDDEEDNDSEDEMLGFEDREDVDIDVFRSASSLSDSDKDDSAQPAPKTSTERSASYLSQTSDSDVDGQDENFSPRQRRQYGSSQLTKMGGKDSGPSYRIREFGKPQMAGRDSGRQVLRSSDDEEDDNDSEDEMSGFEGSEKDVDIDVFRSASLLSDSDKDDSAQPAPKTSTERSASYLSQTRFDQCSISPLSLKGIKAAGYERMTVVQEETLPIILKGKDVLAKAKTGTGKTVAFLLPAIEVVVKLPPPDRDQKRPPINVLVICPTRELANQAAAEANTLLKYHPSIGVQVVIGGTKLPLEQKRMQANPCQILVATPGRLKDHIENTPGFATRLMGVKVLVLDEADHLLDMGFRKDIEKIVAAVPKQRQTLLFSATVPEEVRQICHIALKRDHEFINTVEEGTEETHSQVRQMHLVAPLEKHFSMLYAILKEHISEDVDYKVLVFCTTAMVTRLVAGLLSELNLNVREIHSRKPQSYRTRVSDEFRKSKGLILVTSDVSARGVDYPDVSLVVQLGVPSDREQYIHRLGRTGRKGKEGKGILLLAPWEDFFLATVRDLPITKASLPSIDPDTRKSVERAVSHVEMKNKEAAYQAWLGYYNSNKNVGRDKCRLVELANEFSRSMGLDNPPAIPKLVLGKMGLRNVVGLRAR